MKYDIAPLEQKYRGMERALSVSNILDLQNQTHFDIMLDTYFLYLEYSVMETNHSLEEVICFYKQFVEYGIPCEMIAYDLVPIDEVAGFSLELLGIDIIHEMCESLISDEVNPKVTHLLNENGLCRTIEDVKQIIPYQDHGGVEWQPCYVYKMNLKNDLK